MRFDTKARHLFGGRRSDAVGERMKRACGSDGLTVKLYDTSLLYMQRDSNKMLALRVLT